jgi:hypothetical protein
MDPHSPINLDPDPYSLNRLGPNPDPHNIDADPKHD